VANEPIDDEEVQRVVDTVSALETANDPAERAQRASKLLKEWPTQQARLRKIRQEAIKEMRQQRMTYRAIGEMLGIHYTRVKQIEMGETTSKSKRKR
jgi:DNA-directed RNA polymerase sigma subunit (sigma70/sigma32)